MFFCILPFSSREMVMLWYGGWDQGKSKCLSPHDTRTSLCASFPVQSRTGRFCNTVMVTLSVRDAKPVVTLLSVNSRVIENRNGVIKSITAVHNDKIMHIQGFDIGGVTFLLNDWNLETSCTIYPCNLQS